MACRLRCAPACMQSGQMHCTPLRLPTPCNRPTSSPLPLAPLLTYAGALRVVLHIPLQLPHPPVVAHHHQGEAAEVALSIRQGRRRLCKGSRHARRPLRCPPAAQRERQRSQGKQRACPHKARPARPRRSCGAAAASTAVRGGAPGQCSAAEAAPTCTAVDAAGTAAAAGAGQAGGVGGAGTASAAAADAAAILNAHKQLESIAWLLAALLGRAGAAWRIILQFAAPPPQRPQQQRPAPRSPQQRPSQRRRAGRAREQQQGNGQQRRCLEPRNRQLQLAGQHRRQVGKLAALRNCREAGNASRNC